MDRDAQAIDRLETHIRGVGRLRVAAGVENQLGAADSENWPLGLDLEALAEREPQPPRFILPDWLPAGYATLLAGHGGVGKSSIALHLAVCTAAGVDFFGLEAQRRRVLYLSCEDREDVLHWRLRRICAHLGLDLASLRGWLQVLDLVGRDTVLWEKDSRTGLALTIPYWQLAERVREHQTQVLVVDGVSDTYGGNENSRAEVKRFINALLGLIPAGDGALVLVGHVAKPTASGTATSEGYSGSTAWHNAVRARWYLRPEVEEGEDQQPTRTGKLVLELQKSNLGRTDQSMRFAWDSDARLFLSTGLDAATTFDRSHRERTERAAILRAFKSCAEQKPPLIVPAAMQGPRTAANTLRERAEWPATLKTSKADTGRFRRMLEVLRQHGLVEEQGYIRADRHRAIQLVLTEKGLRECGQ